MRIKSFLEVWTLLGHVANRIVNDTQNGTDSVNYFPVVDTGPLPKNCSEPPFQLIGPEHTSCGLLEPLFYYNITEGTCLQHYRTGCLRSANSFFSLEECEMTCMNPVFNDEDEEDDTEIEVINDSNNNTVVKIKKVGKKPSNKEKKIIDNNIIETPTSDTVLAPEECMLPFEMGPCTNYSVRFGLQFGSNARDSMCKPFVYGSCGGNANNFETLEECLQVCKWSPMSFIDSKNEDDDDEGTHDCLDNPFDPEDEGTCTDPSPVYFYNHTEGECQLTDQPVCHRTLNNFDSLQECETVCRYYIAQERGTCTIRPQTGSCRTFFKRYYYDSTDGMCKQFVYGGCHGNSNRFRNLQECQKICGSPIEEENAVDHQLAVQGDLYYRSPLGVPLPAIKVIKMKNLDCSASPIHPLDLKWGVTFCGYQQIFFYNTSLNECQRLMLRQCRKTDNSFRSLAECKSKCVDQFAERPGRSHRQNTENEIAPKGPNFVSSCEEIMCPWHLWSHYVDRGCEPVYDDGSCCPLHFNCPFTSTEGPSRFMECVHKGRRYPVGSFVNVSNPCDICFCSSGPDGAKIQCVEVACPEDYSPARSGCVYVSEPGKCCRTLKCGTINMSVGQVIHLDSSISCQLDNKSFSEGEDIIFEGNPCHKCICSPNFAGAYGPGCLDINCHLDLEFEFESRGCVPVYREDVCCPVDWHCPPYSDHSRPNVDNCLLPREKGNCKGRFVRYHYEAERGKCYKFIYSGCGGNDNNFLSRQACERQCSRDICALPPSKGSCTNSAKLRYYYSPSQEKCLNFVFRCFGNANNFEDEEECEATCGLQKSLTDAEKCGLLVEPGPCNSPRIRYYFNPITEKCEEFIYGGCRGNENNFKTLEECHETCTPIREDNKIQEAEEAMCSFAGVDYSLGHVMKTTDPCVSCTCVTPPQFTCIKEECQAPNANEYIFCLKRISPELCCTEYKCAKNIDEVCELIEGQPCDVKLDCFLIGDNCLDGGCTLGCRRKYSTRKRPT